MMKIERGDVFLASLDPTRGQEIKKTRPVVIVSNNIANEFSNLVTVVPLTSQKLDRVFKFEVYVGELEGLDYPSKALVQQIRAIDKSRLLSKLAKLSKDKVTRVNEALKLHLALK